MEKGFEFTDEILWPTPKLLQRLGRISWQTEHIPYSAIRKGALDHESRTIMSEVRSRATLSIEDDNPPTLPLELPYD